MEVSLISPINASWICAVVSGFLLIVALSIYSVERSAGTGVAWRYVTGYAGIGCAFGFLAWYVLP